MRKKIIIHIENLTVPQEVLLQELLQSFYVEQIEVLEDTTSNPLEGRKNIWIATI